MSWKNVIADCGCVIEMNLSHDWESGVTDAEDVSIISACKAHSPTKLAPDAGDSAASSELVQASALSTSKTLSTLQRG